MTTTKITHEQESRLRSIFDRGLCSGMGKEGGQVCVEAAVSLALYPDGGLSDAPECVAAPDRRYAIRINDAAWSSPEVRADALWPLALAQVGTAGTDRCEWVRRVVEGTIRRVVPMVMERAAEARPYHAEALRAAAERCRREGTREAALSAKKAAAYTTASAASAATYAASAAAYTAASADAAAAAAAAADAYAAYAAYAYAYADAEWRDRVLRESVSVALDAYKAEGRHE